jgi:hypothetical protein
MGKVIVVKLTVKSPVHNEYVYEQYNTTQAQLLFEFTYFSEEAQHLTSKSHVP